ncbi:MAG: hypothetical protein EHM55_17880 [Acidobacteria bacterium]|nr:MAG: hypothetical protein EHM55_17880 [Acidobacteriota bacterium]
MSLRQHWHGPLGDSPRKSMQAMLARVTELRSYQALGVDHFEGRTYPGWHHHIVLTALAHAFSQQERLRRAGGPTLTLPQVRAIAHEDLTKW